jgi:glycosyltransferase involved in cell wall biosynthesis
MRILFIHKDGPGQFVHLARHLAADPANDVVFITEGRPVRLPNARCLAYPSTRLPGASHRYVHRLESAVQHGQALARASLALAHDGWRPDVVVAHAGWGEALFIKDVFPRAGMLAYCEFYYAASGADIGFDPEDLPSIDDVCQTRIKNAHLLLSLEAADRAYSPTEWQKHRHPKPFHHKIAVIFDGIDTDRVTPRQVARFVLTDGRVLTRADEVVTYIARDLEPYRGFPSLMRALPELCRRRPAAQIVIAGGDGVSYGRAPPAGGSWRDAMLREVSIDPARVHFVGRLPYERYLELLQISSLHVYLTVPFVLSWSCVEALAAGCVVLGSATPPVVEVLREGENGFLVDFFAPAAIAERAAALLDERRGLDRIRANARQTVLDRYSLARCLPRQLRLVSETAARH